jgi:cyclic-di-GMP-binding protein
VDPCSVGVLRPGGSASNRRKTRVRLVGSASIRNFPRNVSKDQTAMAQQNSFDVSTGADLQEVDNAINQAMKEVTTRYDFKNTKCTIDFDRSKGLLTLEADDEYKLKALYDVLQTKFVKRGVPLKNLKPGTIQEATHGRARQVATLTQGIPTETAKEIVKAIKAHGFKKVQSAIQGDEVRISSPSRDELQEVMAFLRSKDFGVELKFGNYRS